MGLLMPKGTTGAVDSIFNPSEHNIDVVGKPTRKSLDYILEATRASPTEDEIAEIVPREGLFGVKGTLRDVLGTLADGFLVQSGNNPMYSPQRDRERVGDAMYGFSQNPVQAIERLAAMGYPQQAQELAEQHSRNQLAQSQITSRNARDVAYRDNIDSQIEGRRQDIIEGIRELGANMLGDADENNLQNIFDIVRNLADRNGLSMEDLGIPEDMTLEEAKVFARSGMTAAQRSSEEDREARRSITEREAASRNANRANQISNRNRRTGAYVNKQSSSGSSNTSNQAKRAQDILNRNK